MGNEGTDDAHLVAQARGGDLAAFEELVRRHQTRVYNLAYRLVGDAHEAEDIAQEAFVRAYRSLKAFRGEAAFGTWLHQITANVAKNHLRSWSRRRRGQTVSLDVSGSGPDGEDPPALEVADPGASPREHAVSHEIEAQVQQALGELPAAYRTVVVLRDIQGLSYEEVATVVGLPVGTVKAQIHRGRLRLRELLRAKGVGIYAVS